ncbi:hypothetical protein D3C80_2032260 [compost metagenome]
MVNVIVVMGLVFEIDSSISLAQSSKASVEVAVSSSSADVVGDNKTLSDIFIKLPTAR